MLNIFEYIRRSFEQRAQRAFEERFNADFQSHLNELADSGNDQALQTAYWGSFCLEQGTASTPYEATSLSKAVAECMVTQGRSSVGSNEADNIIYTSMLQANAADMNGTASMLKHRHSLLKVSSRPVKHPHMVGHPAGTKVSRVVVDAAELSQPDHHSAHALSHPTDFMDEVVFSPTIRATDDQSPAESLGASSREDTEESSKQSTDKVGPSEASASNPFSVVKSGPSGKQPISVRRDLIAGLINTSLAEASEAQVSTSGDETVQFVDTAIDRQENTVNCNIDINIAQSYSTTDISSTSQPNLALSQTPITPTSLSEPFLSSGRYRLQPGLSRAQRMDSIESMCGDMLDFTVNFFMRRNQHSTPVPDNPDITFQEVLQRKHARWITPRGFATTMDNRPWGDVGLSGQSKRAVGLGLRAALSMDGREMPEEAIVSGDSTPSGWHRDPGPDGQRPERGGRARDAGRDGEDVEIGREERGRTMGRRVTRRDSPRRRVLVQGGGRHVEGVEARREGERERGRERTMGRRATRRSAPRRRVLMRGGGR